MKYIYTIAFLWVFNQGFCQVGIGTITPESSSILDVSATNLGVLIPRVALIALNNSSPLGNDIPEGTIVFNISNAGEGINSVIPGVYIWQKNRWVFPASIGVDSQVAVQFNNEKFSSTNFNPNRVHQSVQIDIFHHQKFNDDSDVFEKIDTYRLKVKKEGLYLVSANLALRIVTPVEDSRINNYIHFKLDGRLASSSMSTLVPQFDPKKTDIDGRFAFGSTSYMQINAGQIITLESEKVKDGKNYDGEVTFDRDSLSSITIIRLQ